MIEIKIVGNNAGDIMNEIRTLANRLENNSGMSMGVKMSADNGSAELMAEDKPKAATKGKSSKAATKPVEAMEDSKPEEYPKEEEKAEAKTSIDDVKKAMAKVINAEKETEVKKIFESYGASKLSELKPKDYDAVIADLNAV